MSSFKFIRGWVVFFCFLTEIVFPRSRKTDNGIDRFSGKIVCDAFPIRSRAKALNNPNIGNAPAGGNKVRRNPTLRNLSHLDVPRFSPVGSLEIYSGKEVNDNFLHRNQRSVIPRKGSRIARVILSVDSKDREVNGSPHESDSRMRRFRLRAAGSIWKTVKKVIKISFVRPLLSLKHIITRANNVTEDVESNIDSIEILAVKEISIEPSGSTVDIVGEVTKIEPIMTGAAVSIKPGSKSNAPDRNKSIEAEGTNAASENSREDTESTRQIADAIQVRPRGKRWAVSSRDIDLTGKWKLTVSEEFRKGYENYLRNLGQPLLVRSIALSIIGMTTEETKQTNHGRDLWIKGVNARGIWERTIHASGSDFDLYVEDHTNYDHRRTPIVTADSENVDGQAWWEEEGTVHVSWLKGGKKYGGGDFESRRYLESNGDVLVCESVFHPQEPSREKATVTWRFEREQ